MILYFKPLKISSLRSDSFMLHLNSFLFSLLFSLFLVSCDLDDQEVLNFIEVELTVPGSTESTEIRVEAKYTGLFTEESPELGFVWSNELGLDNTVPDPNFFFHDRKVNDDMRSQNGDDFFFSAIISGISITNKTKIRAFVKTKDELYESKIHETFRISPINLGPSTMHYQGGFSLEVSGKVNGLDETLAIEEHGFCWSYETPCPQMGNEGVFCVELGQLVGTDSFSYTIDDLVEDEVLYIRSYVITTSNGVTGDPVYENCSSKPIFDGNLNYWQEITISCPPEGCPPARTFAVGFASSTKGYIGTGLVGSSGSEFETNDFWEFDPDLNSWIKKADLGQAATESRSKAVGFSIGNDGFLGTGTDLRPFGEFTYQDIWRYNLTRNGTWEKLGDFGGGPRVDAVALVLDETGFVGTGEIGFLSLKNDFWAFNPSNTESPWTPEMTTSFFRKGAVGFTIVDSIYIGTGTDEDGIPRQEFWRYIPGSGGSWTQIVDFPGSPREHAVGFSIENKGYIGAGSEFPEEPLNDFWAYDPEHNEWFEKHAIPSPLNGAVGFAINGKGYIGTGTIDENLIKTNQFWVFFP